MNGYKFPFDLWAHYRENGSNLRHSDYFSDDFEWTVYTVVNTSSMMLIGGLGNTLVIRLELLIRGFNTSVSKRIVMKSGMIRKAHYSTLLASN